jgi:hypothetical protein
LDSVWVCGAVDVSPDVSFTGHGVDILVVIEAVEPILELDERIQVFAVNPETIGERLKKGQWDSSLGEIMTKVIRTTDVPDINLAVKPSLDGCEDCFNPVFGCRIGTPKVSTVRYNFHR